MRYGTRVGVDLVKKKAMDEANYKVGSKVDFFKIQESFRNGTSDTDPHSQRELAELRGINGPDFEGHQVLSPEKISEAKKAYAIERNVLAGKTHHSEAEKETARRTVQDFETRLEIGLGKESHQKVKKLDLKADIAHDSINGVMSLIGTGIYARRVASDIRSVFAETVAYENDKDVNQLGISDFLKSDNVIVDKAIKNFVKLNTLRVASDLTFFVRAAGFIKTPGVDLSILKRAPGTDLGMAVKGAMLSADILTRQSTLFEDIVRLIDVKLNPATGLGDNVTTSEVVDLYQKFAMDHKKEGAFRNTKSYTEVAGNVAWKRSEGVFTRIAELMNHTYHYKTPKGAENSIGPTADFPLPKYLFLLGHDMVDINKPEQTLAYVEVANKHGMRAVKEMAKDLKGGMALDDVLKKFPVELPDVIPTINVDRTARTSTTQNILAQGKQSLIDRVHSTVAEASMLPRTL